MRQRGKRFEPHQGRNTQNLVSGTAPPPVSHGQVDGLMPSERQKLWR